MWISEQPEGHLWCKFLRIESTSTHTEFFSASRERSGERLSEIGDGLDGPIRIRVFGNMRKVAQSDEPLQKQPPVESVDVDYREVLMRVALSRCALFAFPNLEGLDGQVVWEANQIVATLKMIFDRTVLIAASALMGLGIVGIYRQQPGSPVVHLPMDSSRNATSSTGFLMPR